MELSATFWIVSIAAFAAGCAVGAALYGLASRRGKDAAALRAKLEETDRELAAYKSSVADHFSKTSALVNELTQDYVKVYRHLSEGARALGGEPRSDMDLLERQQGKVLIAVPEDGPSPGAGEADGAGNEAAAVPAAAASRDHISQALREAAEIAGEMDERPPGAQAPAADTARGASRVADTPKPGRAHEGPGRGVVE